MNRWEIAGLVIIVALLPCVGVAAFASSHCETGGGGGGRGTGDGTALMVLSEGFHRQPFVDLAVVMALVSVVGSLDVRADDGGRPVSGVRHAVPAVLLVAGVGLEVSAVLGVSVMRDVLDRLHYVSLAGFGRGAGVRSRSCALSRSP